MLAIKIITSLLYVQNPCMLVFNWSNSTHDFFPTSHQMRTECPRLYFKYTINE